MADHQEWMSKPISKPGRPIRKRIAIRVMSFVSLLLGVLGLALVGYTALCAWLIVDSPNRPLAAKLALLFGCSAVVVLALMVALRVVLSRDRKFHQ
jgi:hypothetical protein